ncbi:unnamed protein product [Thelazia callipaeda]|uniref:hydroxyacylglutathione hydrolase n=1 Tax=Thelazia callipaeda TaxID=103827 RepID=A0A0N5D8E8_THECL|nr:unnamed protein product [Thelazia callipaeda]
MQQARSLVELIRTVSITFINQRMKVIPIRALSDNFMYLLVDESTKESAIVDPVNLSDINDTVKKEGVKLTSALVTHHHWDHSGATQELPEYYKDLIIYGGDSRIKNITNKIKDGDTFKVGDLVVKCIHTPCHTTGSICYYVTDNNGDKVVFTGDTLFVAGCGRFFEGTAAEMDIALNDKLSSLPNDTKVYCGHDYTVSNLKFACSVEPNNEEAKKKLAWAEEQQTARKFTVPSTIAAEKLFNPFMRVRISEELRVIAKSTNPTTIMAKIRSMKNKFNA